MIPSSGAISMHHIASEFNLKKPFAMAQTNTKTGLDSFYGKSKESIITESLIYEDTAVLNFEIANRRPQTPLDVFNSWGRYNDDEFAENKDAASGDAAAWTFNTTTNAVEMPLNVSKPNGFVSNLGFDNYNFESTLSSTSADNDGIGLVAAFVRIGGVNHTISFVASQSGVAPASGIGVYLNYGHSGSKQLNIGSVDVSTNVWTNHVIRLKIVRDGDIIKFYNSPMDSEIPDPSTEFILDLSADPDLEKFRGKAKYGYMTYSQPYSTYTHNIFSGGVDSTVMLDVPNDTVWEFDPISEIWEDSGKKVTNELSGLIVNPEGENGFIYIYNVTPSGIVKLGEYTEKNNISSRSSNRIIPKTVSVNTTIPTGTKIVEIRKEHLGGEKIYDSDILFTHKEASHVMINFDISQLEYTLDESYIITDTNECFFVETAGGWEQQLNLFKIDTFNDII